MVGSTGGGGGVTGGAVGSIGGGDGVTGGAVGSTGGEVTGLVTGVAVGLVTGVAAGSTGDGVAVGATCPQLVSHPRSADWQLPSFLPSFSQAWQQVKNSQAGST